jgi:hypothetical protein
LFVLEIIVFYFESVTFVRHGHIVEVAILLDGVYSVLLVYVRVA